ncbi:lipopolysaccharide kinase InaA family protein [Hoylesella marshii]|uniref:lipopolysaccharide kinase InaA family protein n=1 Tax=Hoylesella marshii TaxID=189722 RepID=UPI0028D40768|nr:lipopolysaccharide kinase InaA family protein [Hoylesella marshii]
MQKVLLNAPFESLRSYIESLPSRFESEGTYIYGGRRNLIKSFVAPDGTELNVKRFHSPKGLNRLVYSLGLRCPKGLRAFRYPSLLLPKGIETPASVAYIESRHAGMLGLSYFVSIQCKYPNLLYEVGQHPESDYDALARALGKFTAHMHDARVLHLDYSPGNILWTCDEDGCYHFSIIDINRMYFGKVSLRRGADNFRRLWGSIRFFKTLLTTYAEARGLDVEKTVERGLQTRYRFWKRYSKKYDISFPLEL